MTQEAATDSEEKELETSPDTSLETSPDTSPAESQEGDFADSGAVIIAERYHIHSDQPLPELNSPHAHAFSVSDPENPRNDLFALVATQHLLHRVDVLSAARTLPPEYVLRPIDWGSVQWPGRDNLVFGAVFHCPKGKKVVTDLNARFRPVRVDELTHRYITPIVVALRAFASRDIPYRALRPDNLFFADQEGQTIIMGENFMSPPGFDQPAMFETIPNAMCQPYSRSRGSLDDDLYALGVTILFFYLGQRPAAGLNDEDLLTAKAEYGSYTALTGRQHVTRELKEIIQGLVVDEVSERWNIDRVGAWLDGHRGPPLQPPQVSRSARPIQFNEKEYFSCSSLAHGMFLNWETVTPLIENGDIQNWVAGSFSGTPRDAAVDTVLTHQKLASDQSNKDTLISNLCIALNPEGPLRFKDLSFMLDGLGSALMAVYGDKEKTRTFCQLMTSDVPFNWISYHAKSGVDVVLASRDMQRVRNYMGKEMYGYGLLRCLYEFNDSLCCMSPLFKNHFVTRGEEFIKAFEEIAADYQSGTLPIDKHIAAFIAARFFENLDAHFDQLSNSNDPVERTLAIIRIFAILQWKTGPRYTPHLAQWLGELLPPLVLRYHNRRTREKLRKKIPKAIESGSLVNMLNVIDNPDKLRKDRSGYEAASEEFSKAASQIAFLKSCLLGENRNLTIIGHRSAALFLTFLSIIAIGFSFYSF